MRKIILAAALVAGLGAAALRAEEPGAANVPAGRYHGLRGQIEQFLGADDISSWRDFSSTFYEEEALGTDLLKTELEIRTADEKKVVARLKYAWSPGTADRTDNAGGYLHLDRDHADAMAVVGEGSFLTAWVRDGKRVSNVAAVTVNSRHQPTDDAGLRLTVDEPAGKGLQPIIVLHVVPTELVAVMRMQAVFPTIEWDGKEMPLQYLIYEGPPDGLLPEGKVFTTVVNLKAYGVEADWSQGHTLTAHVGALSQTIKLGANMPLGEAWDAAKPAAMERGAAGSK